MASPKVITLSRLIDMQIALVVDIKQVVDPAAIITYTIADANGANAVQHSINPAPLTAQMITQLKAMIAAAITLANNTDGTTVT